MNVHDGELAICRILADIEQSTGDWVEAVEISDTDVTTVSADRQQLLRAVTIKLKPKPGAKWAT